MKEFDTYLPDFKEFGTIMTCETFIISYWRSITEIR